MVTLAVDLALGPVEARAAILDELALAGLGTRGEEDRIVLEWQPGEWEAAEHGQAELRLEPVEGGTRVTLELERDPDLLAAWFVSQAVAPLLRAASPEAYGDWLTDRRARRPSGAEAREVYADRSTTGPTSAQSSPSSRSLPTTSCSRSAAAAAPSSAKR